MTNCSLCGGKLNDDDHCPLCGEGGDNGSCAVCAGKISNQGWCLRCGRGYSMTDADLSHVVGGMGILGGIGVGLTVLRLFQGRLIRRDLAKRN